MLIDVLKDVAIDTGSDPIENRQTLLELLNRAATEMYHLLECNKIYWENTLVIPPNKIISLPAIYGEIRGLRRSNTEVNVDFHGMTAPRYVRQDWSHKWNNWRDLGDHPIMRDITVLAPLNITTATAEDVTLLITGKTSAAARIEEEIVMDATSKVSTNTFEEIYNIACLSDSREANITVKDSADNILAVLENTSRQTRYKWLDVSQFPWSNDDGVGNTLIDILYKVPLRKLTKDSDSFPAGPEFDNAWYHISMYFYYLPIQNKGEAASSHQAAGLLAMKRAKNGSQDKQDDRLSFGRNKYYDHIRCEYGYYPAGVTNINPAP